MVIAQRDKCIGKVVFALGVLVTALSLSLGLSGWYPLTLALGVCFMALGGYLGILLPKTAILKEEEELIFCFAFQKKRVPLSKIAYVTYNERGPWYTRRGDIFLLGHIYQNDIRSLTVTVNEEVGKKHFVCLGVLHASAVGATLNALVEQQKKDAK